MHQSLPNPHGRGGPGDPKLAQALAFEVRSICTGTTDHGDALHQVLAALFLDMPSLRAEVATTRLARSLLTSDSELIWAQVQIAATHPDRC